MSEPAQSEVAILNAAVELREPERSAYLDQACAGDAALRQRVEELLQAHERAEGFLEVPPAGLNFKRAAPAHVPLSENPGDKIGPYKLLQQIGEGGCGVVYMAEQDKPIRRRVALKIIKLGMDTRQVVARFDAERQALALMDHPNIAKVLDAGATETGRLFFVMELVRGTKITDYCDQNNLSTQERLDLFIQVCHAVQHAHQKGIIHRDLKPSNILVTVNDGVAVPKVIDFGIAKATQGRLTDQTVFTAFEQFIGTPAYMSPEQAVMTSLDIDTRSDIYSLGVLLYELLTGKTPFDQKELLAAGLDEMRRTIREMEPPKPSTRLTQELNSKLESRKQKAETEKTIHLIRGDLDWIVMKCLEKDRARRYDTANGLAMDIQRHLNSEPVVACPPSRLYEFQKTVRRHKFGFGAAAALIIVLAVGVFVSTREAIRAGRAEGEQIQLRKLAQANEQKARTSERNAVTEAAKSRQVAQFLQDMLAGVSPYVAQGRDTTLLREIVDKTARRLDTDLAGQPEVEVELLSTVTSVYQQIGEYTNAIALRRRALELRRKLYGNESTNVAKTLMYLSQVLNSAGQGNEAETTAREAFELNRKLLPADDPQALRAQVWLASLLAFAGKFAEAEPLQRDVVAKLRFGSNPTNDDLADALAGLAITLGNTARYPEAESVAREALAIHEKLHSLDSARAAYAFDALGMALERQGKVADAELAYRRGLAVRRKLLGDSHPDLGFSFEKLTAILSKEGKLDEAVEMYRRELAFWNTSGIKDERRIEPIWNSLNETLIRAGKYVEVESNYLDRLEFKRRSGDRAGTALVLNDFAWNMATVENAKWANETNAVKFAQESVALTGRTNANYVDTLAAAYAEAGQFTNAANAEKEAIGLLTSTNQIAEFTTRLNLYQTNTPYREP